MYLRLSFGLSLGVLGHCPTLQSLLNTPTFSFTLTMLDRHLRHLSSSTWACILNKLWAECWIVTTSDGPSFFICSPLDHFMSNTFVY